MASMAAWWKTQSQLWISLSFFHNFLVKTWAYCVAAEIRCSLRSPLDRDTFGSIDPGDARSKDPRPRTGVSLFIGARFFYWPVASQ